MRAGAPESLAYASAVVSYEPGDPAPGADAADASSALGPPDYVVDRQAPPRAVSIGNGGTLVLRFEGPGLGDAPGPDLYVFEIGAPEAMEVSISDDGATWRELGRIPGGAMAIPDRVLFDFDDDRLRSPEALDETLREIALRPGSSVTIEGHTDELGSPAYNQSLSERRAESVAICLVSRGVARGRLRVRGFGAARPEATGHDEESRRRNRRVEIVIDDRR